MKKLKLTFSSADMDWADVMARVALAGLFPTQHEERTMMREPEAAAAGEDGNGSRRLMSIREVSTITGVPPHTLRFWEKEMPNILRPERTPGGQRRYDSEAMERVRMIKRLSDERRYSLAAIRDRLGSAQDIAEPPPDFAEHRQAKRAVDLIVDEIGSLLKERLFHLLELGEPGNGE